MDIPQSSPRSEYLAHREEIDAAVLSLLESGWYILGREVDAFEQEFASFLGVADCAGVASGTDALELALRALGIGDGDAVFTVSHTAVATIAAIERAGAIPVLLDVDDETYTLDPGRLEDAVACRVEVAGVRPRAVVVVHLYGHPAAMPQIVEIARRAGLLVVEDCAQAHGARLDGQMMGTVGDAASFSFYPTKNVGAIGDGGLVASNEASVIARVRALRQYGWKERYVSAEAGINSRLDEIQATILRVKLRHLEAGNSRRVEIAGRYHALLEATRVRRPVVGLEVEHVFHQYVIRTDDRDALESDLRVAGVGTAIHYPVPVHRQPAYAGRLPMPHDLRVTDRLVDQILSLPMFPALEDPDVDRICAAIVEHERTVVRSPT